MTASTLPALSILPSSLPMGKADNQILGVVRAMQDQHPDKMVVLVSKDINMRIKARTMGLPRGAGHRPSRRAESPPPPSR